MTHPTPTELTGVNHPHPGTDQKRIFFPNLDGLRFFSFLAVYLCHSIGTEYEYIQNEWWYRFFKVRMFSDGDMGVGFFFVLSGFLITYLLLKEKEFTGKIDVKSFYVRRVLRIWPLYYLSVFIGFVIFPFLKSYFGQTPGETADPLLCTLFLNNFNAIINGPPDSSILSVLWSVAIEEQFYLFWPVLFFLAPTKYYHYLFIAVIAASLIFRATHLETPVDFHTLGVISDMAIGGLGAYLAINNRRFLKNIEKTSFVISLVPYVAVLGILIFKQDLFSGPFTLIVKRVVISFFFCWIILDQNFCRRNYFKVSKLKTVSWLGKYTYGLYCLHSIAVLVVIVLLTKLGLNKSSWQILLIQVPAGLILSIGISYISYHLYEKWFLKLKNRFAYIVK